MHCMRIGAHRLQRPALLDKSDAVELVALGSSSAQLRTQQPSRDKGIPVSGMSTRGFAASSHPFVAFPAQSPFSTKEPILHRLMAPCRSSPRLANIPHPHHAHPDRLRTRHLPAGRGLRALSALRLRQLVHDCRLRPSLCSFPPPSIAALGTESVCTQVSLSRAWWARSLAMPSAFSSIRTPSSRLPSWYV
jgi:hypothetical protein